MSRSAEVLPLHPLGGGANSPAPPDEAGALREVVRDLTRLRKDLLRVEARGLEGAGKLDPVWEVSARNLLHYVALRRPDLRDLQDRLAALGLSSLGRCESRVLANVDAVLRAALRLSGEASDLAPALDSFHDGATLLGSRTSALLGRAPRGRDVRILVTLPSEAAEDYALVSNLIASGMDCVRINCAHDDAEAWGRMIRHVRRAARSAGTRCRVLMDLGGPKLRTGAIAPAPGLVRWKPRRDRLGRVVEPANVWLHADGSAAMPPAPAAACLPVGAEFLAALRKGSRIVLRDARGRARKLTVGRRFGDGVWASCGKTAYVTPGTELVLDREGRAPRRTAVGDLPREEEDVVVCPGDTLLLTRPKVAGRPAVRDASGALLAHASVPCTMPQVFADVRVGQRVFLDDGRIGGVVRKAGKDRIAVEITQARAKGEHVLSDKGINLPDTELRAAALTPKDLEDLEFVARHADAVSLSFVRRREDVERLQARLSELGGADLGIVLKIETRRGFERLPDLLLAAMRSPCVGVMIARGDLAVELGYERLAEVQEEILWFCEAAHVPAIWATQVLESLAKDGRPSRAEITDAAMGERAECVMLNKGPHVCEAVRMLDDILRRMRRHHRKKRSMLRGLRLAREFGAAD